MDGILLKVFFCELTIKHRSYTWVFLKKKQLIAFQPPVLKKIFVHTSTQKICKHATAYVRWCQALAKAGGGLRSHLLIKKSKRHITGQQQQQQQLCYGGAMNADWQWDWVTSEYYTGIRQTHVKSPARKFETSTILVVPALCPAVAFGKKLHKQRCHQTKGTCHKRFSYLHTNSKSGFSGYLHPRGSFSKISGISSDVPVPDDTLLRSRVFFFSEKRLQASISEPFCCCFIGVFCVCVWVCEWI